MADWGGINITDGTDQAGRISPALQSGYFNVDELIFEQLLAMGAELAAKVNYFNLQNVADGTWAEMFSADEAVIMAMILSTDLKRVEGEFLELYDKDHEVLASFVLRWAHRINFWLNKLNAVEYKSGVALRQKLRGIIEEKLLAELHNLGEIVTRINKQKLDSINVNWLAFGRVWRIEQVGVEHYFPHASLEHEANQDQIKLQLRSVFYAFFNAVSYLKTITPVYLQESLGSQQHDPSLGLYMVFLKLYEKAQQTLNRFTRRHLDFYYDEVLRAVPRGQTPERLFLLLESQAGTEKAIVAKGTEFTPGKDAELNDIIFTANTDLLASDAKVSSLATLHLQHDPLVSPETEIGYVSRIKSAKPTADLDSDTPVAWPLFGAEKEGVRKRRADDAEMGFAIASSLLLLKEGVRKIELRLALEDAVKADADLMATLLCKSESAADFVKLFGRLFSRYLLAYEGWLSTHHKREILVKAESLLDESTVDEYKQLLLQDWQGLFYKLFKKTFRIKLTTENGWLNVEDYIVEPLSDVSKNKSGGICIVLNLAQEIDPITPYSAEVHGGTHETSSPMLQCCISPQTNFYPYSVFNDLLIKTLEIGVEVKGIKNILAYNQHGQLDPSKPFNPFGPLPSTNSYFVMGNYEIAKKNLYELNVNMEWGDLPTASGGFAEHYVGYETQYKNGLFCARQASLVDGRWQPQDSEAVQAVLLFDGNHSGKVASKKTVKLGVLDFLKPIDAAISEDEYDYTLKSRNGFIKLSLAEPETAFGHAEYPKLLTKVLSENARLKKPLPTPNPPYTPLLNGISLDYKASKIINLTLAGTANKKNVSDKLFHVHPFGIETVYPGQHEKRCYLLPQYAYEGNLFIGLKATQLSGSLTLFFHLSEDLLQQAPAQRSHISWSYLVSDMWKSLAPTRVLSDTTAGFMSSGIVTLDIPADINSDNNVMADGLFWLRVSAKDNAQLFCNCYAVHVNGLELSRKPGTGNNVFPADNKWQTLRALPGIAAISQVGSAFGGRPQESRAELEMRMSERLRHKNRASVPWDYERLILARFHNVAKVKCLSNMVSTQLAPKPGHVLLVVVPRAQENPGDTCARAMLSAVELSEIRSFIQQKTSPFVQIEVRNPAYEEVQVRCTVKFVGGASGGAYINRLDQEVSDYICPWQRVGYKARFGWTIRQKDVESYIRGLEYVEFVTNFSMLHITVDAEGNHSLCDTAKQAHDKEVMIRPRFPWSLAIPARHHFIETMQQAHFIEAEVTGVDELEVGTTFILSGNSDNGEEE